MHRVGAQALWPKQGGPGLEGMHLSVVSFLVGGDNIPPNDESHRDPGFPLLLSSLLPSCTHV